MARYIEFPTADGGTILVEVDAEEVSPPPGVVKAGLKDIAQKAVATAQATYEEAVGRVVRETAQVLVQAAHSLDKPPDEIEITFGLKVTGEVGNVAVGKATGETNYTVKLAWKQPAPE